MQSKSYNFWTYFYRKTLGRPLKLKIGLSRKVKNPALTVIFLHGISANSSTWRATFSELIKNQTLNRVNLISFDLLGFGNSLKADWLDYNYSDYESALKTSLKKLRLKTPVVFVGHSMGSLILANFIKNLTKTELKRLNLKTAVLVSPPVLKSKEVASLPDKFYLKSYSSLHSLADSLPIKALAGFISKISSFRREYLKSTAFAKSMENIILNPRNFATFENLEFKTTVIHGRFDPLVFGPNLESLAKKNKNLELINVIGDHDITSRKRAKIEEIILKAVKDEVI
ncbi:alpha/beta hydrolase [Candidatus Saccharibacteria bacterium]|nr:alpha/beta hydrolase [Candidatus Saccharibacteria bacterium]